MLIGLYPLAAKPYHLGHHMMMQKAAKECDKVILVVSLLDRDDIAGNKMAIIWKHHILPVLPDNVDTIFLKSSPVNRVFDILRLREADPTSDFRFRVYSDENDIVKNFNNELLDKVCPTLLMFDDIERIGVPRSDTIQISGTQMRDFIRNGDFQSFEQFMPDELDKKAVFEILSALDK